MNGVTPGLHVSQVSKFFGEFQALKNVDLSVSLGERRAVIGPNGAGKSTLFHIIGGQLMPTSGQIRLDGDEVTKLPPQRRWRHGLARTFQRNQLFLGLPVAENVRLAVMTQRGIGTRLLYPVTSYRELDADVDAILSRVHLTERRSALAGDLAYGEQRQLELALALVGRPKLLLLDEPTAGMSPAETDAMMTMLQALPRDLTILIVEHDMDVVFALADRVTVMHLGEVLTDGTPEEIQRDARVTQVYFGQGGGRT